MAEIDKALPNVEQTVNIPSPDDIEVAEQEDLESQEDGSPDVQENEDGSVDINFEPGSVNPGQDEGHFANLAELLPDDVLKSDTAVLVGPPPPYMHSRSINGPVVQLSFGLHWDFLMFRI